MTASGLDVRTLKRQLARAERRAKARAFLLVAPLLLFVALSFLSPIFTLVRGAVYNDLVAANLPETTRLLKHWRIDEPPSEPLCAAFVTEMQAAKGKDLALPSRDRHFRQPRAGRQPVAHQAGGQRDAEAALLRGVGRSERRLGVSQRSGGR